MNSLYDSVYLEGSYVPVVHAYYDRADMMESTPEIVDHAHSLCEIMYVNEGMMHIETDEGDVQVGCKQFVWLDSNVRHWNLGFSDGLCSMMNIEYQYEALEAHAPSLAAVARQDAATRRLFERRLRVMTLTDRDNTVYRLLKEIIPLADSTHGQAEKLCSILCVQLMLEIARLAGQNQSQDPITNHYIADALEIMRRDYAEPLTAAIIAGKLHIQPTYLHRLFREHTVRTMNEHLQHIRVQRAQELLLDTDKSLLDIAGDVGINSQQYFSQLFKQIVGVSPSEYRHKRFSKLD